MCFISPLRKKFLNSPLVKTVPLSDTIVSGKPWVANDHLSLSIVAAEVAVFIGYKSNHLECALTMIRNMYPW